MDRCYETNMAKADMWVLLAKQDRGPVLAICSWKQHLGDQWNAELY